MPVATTLVFLLVIAAIVAVSYVAVRRNKQKDQISRQLYHQLSATTKLYVFVQEFDIINDTYTDIEIDEENAEETKVSEHSGAQAALIFRMKEHLDPSWENQVMDFLNFSTLAERLGDRNAITMEFLNSDGIWCRCRFIVSQRTSLGQISRVLWLVEEIDEERKERESLRDISDRAMAASEAKSAFLSNMSHEIRTPINAMLGMNEMILRECSEDSPILPYAKNIEAAGHTLLALVNDILDFSKIEAGKMEIISAEYDLSSVIHDLVQMISYRAEGKGLEFSLEIDPETPKRLWGDDIRLKQIVTNLLTNAVKYTKEGSVVFSIDFEKKDDKHVLLNVAVKDTGSGIKKEDMDKLFSKFDRIGEEKNRHIEGTGLGLSITTRLLNMMGSKLEVGSIYGVGSRFYFTLEQEVMDWEPVGNMDEVLLTTATAHHQYHEQFTAPEANVLVVDDTEMNLVVFTNLLKKTKVNIDTAISGDDALARTKNKKYDLIFLDHMMPHKNGIETLHELREQKNAVNKDTPVVCLTANAVSGAWELYKSEGFDDYLTKPIDFALLEQTVIKYLPPEKVHQM
ncbi:ATP-binding protein [Anaerovibrio lipolyticus]|uniref:ATP-binding protein n=1 Tax=Anaerovibrio lipolyticus TaxID=82374 RepID=UPI0026F0CB67|nr:ATP-binding protein [Anaerovibrio lipolyticus]MBE6104831.1 response regulator [Anaerovibrio lipolyticus]